MRAGKLWPAAIVGVLGVTVLANVVILWAARDRNAAVVEPDYYRKALAWDSTLAQQRVNEALGWRIDAAIVRMDADGATVRVRLDDRAGAPVADAGVALTAIHNTLAGTPVSAALEERAPGRYEARVPLPRPGLWELRFDVRRADDRFTASLRRDTGTAPPPGFDAPAGSEPAGDAAP